MAVRHGGEGVVTGVPLAGLIPVAGAMQATGIAAVMCPMALGTAWALGVNPDSFLRAVVIGASCAFLTRIGHENHTLSPGPGGFRFGDS